MNEIAENVDKAAETEKQAQGVPAISSERRNKLSGRDIACIVLICIFAVPLIMFAVLVFCGEALYIPLVILSLGAIALPAIALCVTRYHKRKGTKQPELSSSLIAIGLEVVAIALVVFSPILIILAVIPLIGADAAAITSMVGQKKTGMFGYCTGVAVLVLPIVAIVVFVLLLSTRVVVIHWM